MCGGPCRRLQCKKVATHRIRFSLRAIGLDTRSLNVQVSNYIGCACLAMLLPLAGERKKTKQKFAPKPF
jgi:hypothetical protein